MPRRVAERRRPGRELLPPAIALALALACRCGDDPTLITIFTDVKYTPDGKALVLHATDGIYVARPVDATPQRVSDQTCSGSASKSLDCVRFSPDGKRLAILGKRQPRGDHSTYTLFDAAARPEGSEGYEVRTVASGVLDAALSQEGSHLVYAVQGSAEDRAELFDVRADGTTAQMVHELALGELAASELVAALVITPYGMAYPRAPTEDGVEARFRPFDREGFMLGTLVKECAGAVFPACVLASADGTAVIWQEKAGGIVHAYRPQTDLDLPLGTGYGYTCGGSGSFVLRMGAGPYTAEMQRVDNAVVVREVLGAASAQLSADGEEIAYLTVESSLKRTFRLWAGASRREGQERDLGVFGEPTGNPLVAPSIGDTPIGHALTGDARFVVLDAPPEQAGAGAGADLVAVNTGTGEKRVLATLECDGCCTVAPSGALVACIPTMSNGWVSGPAPVDLYDPATGKVTRAAEKAILLEPLADGAGVAVLDYQGEIPELLVVTKDGQRTSLGGSLRVAASPDRRQIAWISELGSLTVEGLP